MASAARRGFTGLALDAAGGSEAWSCDWATAGATETAATVNSRAKVFLILSRMGGLLLLDGELHGGGLLYGAAGSGDGDGVTRRASLVTTQPEPASERK